MQLDLQSLDSTSVQRCYHDLATSALSLERMRFLMQRGSLTALEAADEMADTAQRVRQALAILFDRRENDGYKHMN
jgi:hypothetical protein